MKGKQTWQLNIILFVTEYISLLWKRRSQQSLTFSIWMQECMVVQWTEKVNKNKELTENNRKRDHKGHFFDFTLRILKVLVWQTRDVFKEAGSSGKRSAREPRVLETMAHLFFTAALWGRQQQGETGSETSCSSHPGYPADKRWCWDSNSYLLIKSSVLSNTRCSQNDFGTPLSPLVDSRLLVRLACILIVFEVQYLA